VAFRVAAVIWTILALVANAYVHFSLAPQFDLLEGRLSTATVVTLGQLFRAEAILDAVLALAILVRPRAWSGLVVAVVALAGLALTVGSTMMSIPLPFGLPVVPQGEWLQLRVIAAGAQGLAFVGALTIVTRRR
jgi:hypothetical protein